MTIEIKLIDNSYRVKWNRYVLNHRHGNVYQLFDWKEVVEKSYGHVSYYWAALKPDDRSPYGEKVIVGILPVIHIKHFIFGNNLTSMPYFDMGGILSDDESTAEKLIVEACNFIADKHVDSVEIRQTESVNCFETQNCEFLKNDHSISIKQNRLKVRMILKLPETHEQLMNSFKSKLRSQIKKSYKSGLWIKSGWNEMVDDFYAVFLENMRDLGSPVHSKTFIKNVISAYGKKTRVFVVYKDKKPVAGSVVIGHKDILENPWASSIKSFSRYSPNMMLYWEMLKFGCINKYKYFDFGRSTPSEGTYKFKEQWGAVPAPLTWYTFSHSTMNAGESPKSRFETLIRYWQKIPVRVTAVIGPKIRKYISL